MTVTEKNVPCITGFSHYDVSMKIQDFSDLLKTITNLDDKKRQLWREIYENAITDRLNSHAIFATLVNIVEDKSTEHAVHGRTITACIERMSRANDQLIKLAELIAKASEESDQINPDSIYDQIKSH